MVSNNKLPMALGPGKATAEKNCVARLPPSINGGLVIVVFALLSATVAPGANYLPSTVIPPRPMREIRAAWVATVANIDWPSTNNLSTAQQKAELIGLLDRAVQLKLNTIIFQVRPACDAMYASSLEPWSEYLTGTMGKAPEPYYDPLAFAVEEAHRRGLELHAWFNPYRARQAQAKSPIAPNHISRTHPELVRHYGKSLWLDPGERAVQDYSISVVMDVVRRYDLDGVHLDDYFYPYPESDGHGGELPFPDKSSWQRFGAGRGLSRDEWRRENVNEFIRRLNAEIKAVKPWVKFGVSPFGIWRPNNPPVIKGFDAYEKLYADSRRWLANGWLDYFSPQLYWAISAPEQSFPVLLKWWAEQNTQHRLLAPGMDCTKVGQRWKPEEIINQIRLTRKQPGASGDIHWNMKALMHQPALDNALEHEVYSQPALFPACAWLQRTAPARPHLSLRSVPGATEVSWDGAESGGSISLWVFQTRTGTEWTTRILPRETLRRGLPALLPEVIALTAVDRSGNTSRPAVLERK